MFRRKKQKPKVNTAYCEKCCAELIEEKITKENIAEIITKLDLSKLPFLIKRLKEKDRNILLLKLIPRMYRCYKCSSCSFFKLVKK